MRWEGGGGGRADRGSGPGQARKERPRDLFSHVCDIKNVFR